MPFIQGKSIHGLGKYSDSEAVGTLPLDQSKSKSVRRRNTGPDWLGGQGLPDAGRGELATAELEDSDQRMLGSLDRFSLKVEADWGLDLWCRLGHWGDLHFVGPNIWP